jgi:hypothetical protein
MFRKRLAAALTMVLLMVSAMPIASAAIRNPHMRAATDQNPRPAEGKAMVVFVRPSGYGNVTAASLFLTSDDGLIPLGIVYHHEKYAVQLDPGAHRFMVNGSRAMFLDADLEAGKTYYVQLRSEIGPGKAKFQLIPMNAAPNVVDSIHSGKFRETMARAEWTERTPSVDQWFDANKTDLLERKALFLTLWLDPEWKEAPRRKLGPEHAVAETL